VIESFLSHENIRAISTGGIGLPAVGNLVLQKMSGEFIIRLDGDDIFDENILEILVSHFRKDSNLSIVFPDYYLMDPAGIVYSQERRELTGREIVNSDVPPHGACSMIRKQDLIESGGYREDIDAQDGLDLWSRPEFRNRSKHVGLPLFYYRQHGESHSSNQSRILGARRKIKASKLASVPRPVIAVIPCRVDYDFRPNMWNLSIGGSTLLDRRIEICRESSLVDLVVVSSDSEEVEAKVSGLGDPNVQHHWRSHQRTLRSAPIIDTLRDVASIYDPELAGLFVLSYIQTPFVTVELVEEAIGSLQLYGADSALAVEHVSGDLLRRNKNGLEPLARDNGVKWDSAEIYRDSQTFTVVRATNLAESSLFGGKSVAFEVSESEGFFVNTERALLLAELMANKGLDSCA
jgi:CMP-N-acetylneuraminic acid synthetase